MNQFGVNVRLTAALVLVVLVFFVYGVPYGMSVRWAAACTFCTVSLSCLPGKGEMTRAGLLMYIMSMCFLGSALVLIVRPVFPAEAPVPLPGLIVLVNIPVFFGVGYLARESLMDTEWDRASRSLVAFASFPFLGFPGAHILEGIRKTREVRIERKRKEHQKPLVHS